MEDNIQNQEQILPLSDSDFQYRTISVDHLQDMQDYMDKLRSDGFFSDNKVFRRYVDTKSFKLPDNFQDAKYLIVMAVYIPLARVNVPYEGKTFSIFIPPNYYYPDFNDEQVQATVMKEIIGNNNRRIEDVSTKVHLKHLAVHSGLARYGRNNICYVDGMGSMLSLYAYLTDHIFKEDHWTDIRMMDSCQNCQTCINECPTGAISESRFVISVDRCIPLYNEIGGELPEWIPKDAYNALMGCMHCQLKCAANREVISNAVDFEDLSLSETYAILNEVDNEDMIHALSQKLKVCTPEIATRVLPVFSRNLKAFLVAQIN